MWRGCWWYSYKWSKNRCKIAIRIFICNFRPLGLFLCTMTAVETLKKYWGYDSFRPMQEEIISSALDGHDTLAILPTGGGKSICFQVPAMMRDGMALVVTPLIALMKDQVQNLEARGIRAVAVHAGMSRREVDLALNNAAYGDCKFLYVSPERLGTSLFKSYLEVLKVNFIVVDEAHCISQWGYDFRPDYLRIGEMRKVLDATLIALTATATPEVAEDIMRRLVKPGTPNQMKRGLENFTLLRSGFERPNLSYIVRECQDKTGQLLSICGSVPGSGIVYMRNRSKCEEVAALLSHSGVSASFYHAGLESRIRSERQEAWKRGEIRVMVCTNAFGMGIDKPDVRFVVHLGLADSPEAYFQEAGRAGRDGQRSWAVLLWNKTDVRRLHQLLDISFPSLEYIEDIYQKLHIFNQIPYEGGAGARIKFNLEEFARHYSLSRAGVHYAIRYLEMSDHLTFTEDADISTQVKIIADRQALYEINLPDPAMPRLLDALMRGYPGIFSYIVPVSEEGLSRSCGVSVPVLRQLLYGLSLEHIIRYVPCDKATVIYLHHGRLMPGNLNLQKDKYAFLKESAGRRAAAMEGYATESDTCRSRYLLAYFGQTESKDCGCCDVCRSKSARRRTEEAILAWAAAHPGYSLDEFRAWCRDPRNSLSSDVMEVYREMLDKGKLLYLHPDES